MFLLSNIRLLFWYVLLIPTLPFSFYFNFNLKFIAIYGLQGFIILSCVIAVSVNFSTFLVIGKTSPVTYQVLGHLKTCLVLGFGYTLLHDPFTQRNIIGILVAILGMGLYSYFCTHENKKKQMLDLSPASQVTPYFLIELNRTPHTIIIIIMIYYFYFQIKDKDSNTPLLGHQDKENHFEAKKATKDSLV